MMTAAKEKSGKSKYVYRVAETGIMAALICVIAPLSIPLSGGVPISLATFIVMLAGTVLGPRMGTEATLVYILLGLIGVPVFSSYQAGPSVLAGPTGGYIVGYLFLAFSTGIFYEKLGKPQKAVWKYTFLILGMVLGTIVDYAIGTAWFVYTMKTTWTAALTACVYPFIAFDAAKVAVVAVFGPRLEKAVGKGLNQKKKRKDKEANHDPGEA